MATAGCLTIKAGSKAREIMLGDGLRLDRVRILSGASGGPKWLALSGMDLALARLLRNRTRELLCIGSSIGSWRIAALAQKDPQGAIRIFEDSYIQQRYDGRPSAREVTAESRRIGEAYVSDHEIDTMLKHPFMRLGFLAVRSRWPGASDSMVPQGAHLLTAFAANLISRPLLRLFFERTLFHVPEFDTTVIGADPFATHTVTLTHRNFRAAVLASGSIPLVMEGMTAIPDAPPGTYRDGGVIDYHMDLPWRVGEDELVLMPHFFPHMTPGWFDKKLRWRRPRPEHLSNTVLLAPSPDFVATLPGGKIPDRTDFDRYVGRDDERMNLWRGVAARCRVLGDELTELVHARPSAIQVEPLDA
jgi:hypothetical protein